MVSPFDARPQKAASGTVRCGAEETEGRFTAVKTLSSRAPLVNLSLTAILFVSMVTKVAAICGDTQNDDTPAETYTNQTLCGGTFTKTHHWVVSWIDGYDRRVPV